MNATVMEAGTVRDSFLRGRLHGANLVGTKISGMNWIISGSASMGLQLPLDIDFSSFKGGLMCHSLMYVLIYQLFRNHREWSKISRLVDLILGQAYRANEPGRLNCYEEFISTVRMEMPHLEKDLLQGFETFPGMRIAERFELGSQFSLVRTLEDLEDLQETKYAKLFPGVVNQMVKNWKARRLGNGP